MDGAAQQASAKSVLIADNDRVIREAVGDFFRSKGFTVCVAADGLEALDTVRRLRPDHVILDIVMPKISGARVCRLIREDPELHETPIIAFSSLSVHDFRWFPELSPDAYVAKTHLPVACDHLLEAIERIRCLRSGLVSDGLLGYGKSEPHPLVREIFEDRQRLLELLNAVGGIVEVDLQGRILRATPAACGLLGRRELDLIGVRFVELWAPQERDALQAVLEEAAAASPPQRRSWSARLGDQDLRLGLIGIGKGGDGAGIAVILAARD